MSSKQADSATTFEVPKYLQGKMDEDQISDALHGWAQLCGKHSMDWTEPDIPIQLSTSRVARLRDAIYGIAAVTRIMRLQEDATDSRFNGVLRCGLASAAVALSDYLASEIDSGVSFWKERMRNEP